MSHHIDKLTKEFDQVLYHGDQNVKGITISSPKSAEHLIKKLRKAKKAKPEFVRIGNTKYELDSDSSLGLLINGIRIGKTDTG